MMGDAEASRGKFSPGWRHGSHATPRAPRVMPGYLDWAATAAGLVQTPAGPGGRDDGPGSDPAWVMGNRDGREGEAGPETET